MNKRKSILAVVLMMVLIPVTSWLLVDARGYQGNGDNGDNNGDGNRGNNRMVVEASAGTALSTSDQQVRFEVVALYVDSSTQPLAAWQVSFSAVRGQVKIVGIEGGEHQAFVKPPYYDPKAMQNDKAILASFNTGNARELPTGKTRIATLHLMIEGGVEPVYEVVLTTSVNDKGLQIQSKLSYQKVSAP